MKIAFWSNERESGVTSNITAISIACVLAFPYRVLIMENHTNENGIAKYLFQCSRTSIIREKSIYYLGHGATDCLVQKLSKQTNHKIADCSTIEVIENCLFYVPQKALHDDLFEYEFHCNLFDKLEQFDTFTNITMIDTKTKHNLSSKIILQEADLVVVNLTQRTAAIDDFFLQYSSISHKCVFIISSFHQKNRMDKQRIKKHFVSGSDHLAFLPYNSDYQIALEQGRAIQFITGNYDCKRNNPNYAFIKELKNATHMVMNEVREKYVKQKEMVLQGE